MLSELVDVDWVHESVPECPAYGNSLVVLVGDLGLIGDLNIVFTAEMAKDIGGLSSTANRDAYWHSNNVIVIYLTMRPHRIVDRDILTTMGPDYRYMTATPQVRCVVDSNVHHTVNSSIWT